MNWLGADLDSDPFGAALLSWGVPEDTCREWTVDPQVVQPIGQAGGGSKGLGKGSLFDALEDTNREDCLNKCEELARLGATKHVLMVLTSHDQLGDTGEQTGWYLPEVAHPYDEFIAAGYTVTFASPKGGAAPVDIGSVDASKDDPSCTAFIAEGSPTKALVDNTIALADIQDTSVYDAVFFAGGFGTMWDFPDNPDVQRITRTMWEDDKVVSGVCHGPSAFVNVTLSDGTPLVAGKEVAAFTNEEEDAVQRKEVVPFTCQDALTEKGAAYTQGGVFQPHVAKAGRLITGQNPPSAKPTAEAIILCLERPFEELCIERCTLRGVSLRFADSSVPAEKAMVDDAVDHVKPWMELATDVVIGVSTGESCEVFESPAVVSIPLNAGPSQVKQVFRKAVENAPWEIIEDDCVSQRNDYSCQVRVMELSSYYAVCKPIASEAVLRKGYLDKKNKANGQWERRFFVAETPYLKFTGEDGSDTIGEFDLRMCDIRGDEDDPKVFFVQSSDGKEIILQAKDEAEATQWMVTLQAIKDGSDQTFHVGSIEAQMASAEAEAAAEDDDVPMVGTLDDLPPGVIIRFLDADIPAEQAITKTAVDEGSKCSPQMQLATDVVIATPHGHKFASPTRITVPLRGDGRVEKVLHKADGAAPWTVMDSEACEQTSPSTCQITVTKLCYFALLKMPDCPPGALLSSQPSFTTNYFSVADNLAEKPADQVDEYWKAKSPSKRERFDEVVAKRGPQAEELK